jgi:hypothetical protein
MKLSELKKIIKEEYSSASKLNEVRFKSGDKFYRFSPEFANKLKKMNVQLDGWYGVNDVLGMGEYSDEFAFESLVSIDNPDIDSVALYIVFNNSSTTDYENINAEEFLKSIYLGDDEDEEEGYITENELFKKMVDLGWLI